MVISVFVLFIIYFFSVVYLYYVNCVIKLRQLIGTGCQLVMIVNAEDSYK